ncbi:MAG: NAD(P)H-dependent oxidoreductase [Acetobacteraceae bacterium]
MVEEGALVPDIDREVKRRLTADLWIWVFPVFWFSQPAILKGWINRVFLSGLFYGGRRFYGRGPMAGRRALVVTSMSCRRPMPTKSAEPASATPNALGYASSSSPARLAAYDALLRLSARMPEKE